jgi:hypothetical protein
MREVQGGVGNLQLTIDRGNWSVVVAGVIQKNVKPLLLTQVGAYTANNIDIYCMVLYFWRLGTTLLMWGLLEIWYFWGMGRSVASTLDASQHREQGTGQEEER